jgi:hypothetical protein
MMEEARKQAEIKLRESKVKKIRKDVTTLRDKLQSKVITENSKMEITLCQLMEENAELERKISDL